MEKLIIFLSFSSAVGCLSTSEVLVLWLPQRRMLNHFLFWSMNCLTGVSSLPNRKLYRFGFRNGWRSIASSSAMTALESILPFDRRIDLIDIGSPFTSEAKWLWLPQRRTGNCFLFRNIRSLFTSEAKWLWLPQRRTRNRFFFRRFHRLVKFQTFLTASAVGGLLTSEAKWLWLPQRRLTKP